LALINQTYVNMKTPMIKKITPEIAREMLKHNTHNLPVRQSHVNYLASEMAAGRWALTHQGIAVADDGTVSDGQHRLLAVVQSGVTIETYVTRGIGLDLQPLLDKGRIRAIADELAHFDDVAYAQPKAGAARAIISICCHFQSVKMSMGSCKVILNELERDLTSVIVATQNFRPATRGWVVGTLALALSADPSIAPFIEAVGSGENLKAGDPAKSLRDWLLNGGRNIHAKYKRGAIEAVFNAAYNASAGNKITQIKRGVQGLEYFLTKKRVFVETVRATEKQQMEISTPA